MKLAIRSCHLLLIYIGDLERYISQLKQQDNYSEAQRCYKQAQMLAPKNGKSYNQLAVVAVLTKRKLDAVYYYSRSLMASNPIQTARDRLTAIFHEIKKKVTSQWCSCFTWFCFCLAYGLYNFCLFGTKGCIQQIEIIFQYLRFEKKRTTLCNCFPREST